MYFRQTRRVVSRQYFLQVQGTSLHRILRIAFHTHNLLHTDAFAQKLLHTGAFTHRDFYTQTLLHAEAFTHRSFCNRIIIAKVIQLVFVADLLVGASSGCRHAFKAILSTPFFCGYGLAFILWGLRFVIWNGCIESWYLFPVEVTCDCKDRFMFPCHRHVLALHFSCCFFLLVLTKQLAPTRLAPRWPVVGDTDTHNLRPTFWR